MDELGLGGAGVRKCGSRGVTGARAVEQVSVLRFNNAALEQLMDADSDIGYRIMRNVANVMSARIRSTNMKLRNALSDILYY